MNTDTETKSLVSEIRHEQSDAIDVPQQVDLEAVRRIIIRRFTKTSVPLMIVGAVIAGEVFIRITLLSKQGSLSLGADALLGTTSGFIYAVDNGLLGPINPMIAQCLNKREIGNIVRQGWLLGAALSIPTIAILSAAEPILNLFGQDSELTSLVGPYAGIVSLASPAMYWLIVDTSFLTASSRFKSIVAYYTVSAGLGTGLSYLLIPKYGLMGSGYTTLIRSWVAFAGLKCYFATKEFRGYELFNFRELDIKHLKQMIRLGSPLTMFALGDQIRNFVVGMMMGWLGPTQLAIHQASNTFLQFIMPINVGISQATQICVSQFKGVGDFHHMRMSGNLGILCEAGINIVPAIFFCAFSRELTSFFLPEDEIADLHNLIIWVFISRSLSNILDSIQGPTVENLKGLLDTLFPSIIQLVTALAVMMPLSYLLGFVCNWELAGINTAACIGTAINLPPLLWRWYRMSHSVENLSSESRELPSPTPDYDSINPESTTPTTPVTAAIASTASTASTSYISYTSDTPTEEQQIPTTIIEIPRRRKSAEVVDISPRQSMLHHYKSKTKALSQDDVSPGLRPASQSQ